MNNVDIFVVNPAKGGSNRFGCEGHPAKPE
jgi:hypothetical protein